MSNTLNLTDFLAYAQQAEDAVESMVELAVNTNQSLASIENNLNNINIILETYGDEIDSELLELIQEKVSDAESELVSATEALTAFSTSVKAIQTELAGIVTVAESLTA